MGYYGDSEQIVTQGGAIFINNAAMILIDHSTFRGNFGDESAGGESGGGALCINGNVVEISFNITSTIFEDNQISTVGNDFGVGGAILINSADQGIGFEITNSTFVNNSADARGGMCICLLHAFMTNVASHRCHFFAIYCHCYDVYIKVSFMVVIIY